MKIHTKTNCFNKKKLGSLPTMFDQTGMMAVQYLIFAFYFLMCLEKVRLSFITQTNKALNNNIKLFFADSFT